MNDGRFKLGHRPWNEGLSLSPSHKAKVRQKALEREATRNRKVVVGGVVYPNVTQASKAVGLSPRTVKRYAESNKPEHHRFKLIDA